MYYTTVLQLHYSIKLHYTNCTATTMPSATTTTATTLHYTTLIASNYVTLQYATLQKTTTTTTLHYTTPCYTNTIHYNYSCNYTTSQYTTTTTPLHYNYNYSCTIHHTSTLHPAVVGDHSPLLYCPTFENFRHGLAQFCGPSRPFIGPIPI